MFTNIVFTKRNGKYSGVRKWIVAEKETVREDTNQGIDTSDPNVISVNKLRCSRREHLRQWGLFRLMLETIPVRYPGHVPAACS